MVCNNTLCKIRCSPTFTTFSMIVASKSTISLCMFQALFHFLPNIKNIWNRRSEKPEESV